MLTIKKPDLNAPRFRPTRYNVLSNELLDKFKEKYPQYKNIPDSKLREIIFIFDEKIWKSSIENREGVELPEGLGYIFIGTCRSPKKFNVNYDLSVKNNTPLRHRNFESDNYLAKIFYTNYVNKYKFQNREIWEFKGIRDFTRKVSEEYPKTWKRYIQVDNMKYISKVFLEHLRVDRIKVRSTPKPVDYNEFNMN